MYDGLDEFDCRFFEDTYNENTNKKENETNKTKVPFEARHPMFGNFTNMSTSYIAIFICCAILFSAGKTIAGLMGITNVSYFARAIAFFLIYTFVKTIMFCGIEALDGAEYKDFNENPVKNSDETDGEWQSTESKAREVYKKIIGKE